MEQLTLFEQIQANEAKELPVAIKLATHTQEPEGEEDASSSSNDNS